MVAIRTFSNDGDSTENFFINLIENYRPKYDVLKPQIRNSIYNRTYPIPIDFFHNKGKKLSSFKHLKTNPKDILKLPGSKNLEIIPEDILIDDDNVELLEELLFNKDELNKVVLYKVAKYFGSGLICGHKKFLIFLDQSNNIGFNRKETYCPKLRIYTPEKNKKKLLSK